MKKYFIMVNYKDCNELFLYFLVVLFVWILFNDFVFKNDVYEIGE